MFCDHLVVGVFPSLSWCPRSHCWWRCIPYQRFLALQSKIITISNLSILTNFDSSLPGKSYKFCLDMDSVFRLGLVQYLACIEYRNPNQKMCILPMTCCSLLVSSLSFSKFSILLFTLSGQGRVAKYKHNLEYKYASLFWVELKNIHLPSIVHCLAAWKEKGYYLC